MEYPVATSYKILYELLNILGVVVSVECVGALMKWSIVVFEKVFVVIFYLDVRCCLYEFFVSRGIFAATSMSDIFFGLFWLNMGVF